MSENSAYEELKKRVNELESRLAKQGARFSNVDTLLRRGRAYRTRAEKTLRESEEFSSNLLNNAPNPILVISQDTSVRYVNPALENLTGFSSSELIGRKAPYPWWIEEKLQKTNKNLEEAMGKGAQGLEELFQRKNGERFWVEINSTAIKKDSKLKYYLSNWVETTQRKQAEERTRHLNLVLYAIRNVNQLIAREKNRESLLQGICDSLIDTRGYYSSWMALLDVNGEFLTAVESGLGKDFPPMLERLKHGMIDCWSRALRQSDAVVTDDPFFTCVDCPLAHTYAGRGALTVQMEHGERTYGLLTASIPRDYLSDDTELNLFKEIAGDIASALHNIELEEADVQAKEALHRYERIISAAQEHMSLLDRNYVYQAVNDAYLKAHIKKRDEIVGHSVSELLGQKAFDELVKDKLDRCLAGEDIHYQSWFDFPGLGRRYMDVAYYPFFEEDRSVSGVVVASRDITETKRLETQFQQAQRMEAIGTLAGGIAHNFNNVLMGIQGNASLILLGKTPDHPDHERLRNIEQGVETGAELSKQLLGFARGGKYKAVPSDINGLITSQNRMFGHTKKEITIQGKYQDNLWTVEIDQSQINQVILNIYINAWQAMPEGGNIYVQTDNIILDKDYGSAFTVIPGRYVKISITDTGIGMDEKTKKRIFEPFFTTKGVGRGTGLGLASAYGIVKNHDGFINVYSEKGKGSTFTIYLPVSKKEIVKEEKPPEKALKGTETILLIDDEEGIIDVGREILKTLGYKVLVARGGEEAIEIISKAHRAKSEEGKNAMPPEPDIIILDMIMPQMSGRETYDRMKEINPNIKVLLASGYSIDGQATEILKRGCNGFIQKPFHINQLSQELRKILDKD